MIVLIPTAGLATRMQPLCLGLPKVLVCHHDKPILHWILDSYQHLAVSKIILVIAPKDRQLFASYPALYSCRYPIEFVTQNEPKGPLDAILAGLKIVPKNEAVVIHLGDAIFTIPFQPLEFERSFVTVARVARNAVHHWCIAKIRGNKVEDFVDKPLKSRSRAAITGVYYFANNIALGKAVQSLANNGSALKESNISALLRAYIKKETLYIKYRTDWHDMGTLEHLHQHHFKHVFEIGRASCRERV